MIKKEEETIIDADKIGIDKNSLVIETDIILDSKFSSSY